MLFGDLEINLQKKLLSEDPCSRWLTLFCSLVCLLVTGFPAWLTLASNSQPSCLSLRSAWVTGTGPHKRRAAT